MKPPFRIHFPARKFSLNPKLVPRLVPKEELPPPDATLEADWENQTDEPNRPGKRQFWGARVQLLTVALGTAMLVIVAITFYNQFLSNDGSFPYPHEPHTPPLQHQAGLPPMGEAELFDNARGLVGKFVHFMSLDNVEAKSRMVRDPRRVRPLMERYYQTHSTTVQWPKSVTQNWKISQTARMVDRVDVCQLKIDAASLGLFIVIFEKTRDGEFLIDWECLTGYGDMTLAEFITKQPAEPTFLRVRVELGDYYNFGFTSDRYVSLLLTNVDRSVAVHAFAPAKHPITWEVLQFPIMLAAEFHCESINAKSPQVILDHIIRKSWILPAQPEPAQAH